MASKRIGRPPACWFPACCFCSAVSAAPRRQEQHFKVDAHPVITIHNPNGIDHREGLDEIGSDGHREPRQRRKSKWTRNKRATAWTSRRANSPTPSRPTTCAPIFEISVPEDAELQIHNDAGNVNVANVLGDMNVETVAAGVDLEDAAGYLTRQDRRRLVPSACAAPAGSKLSSISGNFRLLDLHSYHVRAQTSTGNILFNGEFLPNGMYSLKNYSGVIEVRFSPGDSFDLSATSLKGKVNNEAKLTPSPHQRHFIPSCGNALFGTFNAGRAKVELTSFDGTINILKRD